MKTNEIYKLKSLFTDHHNNLSVPMIRLFGLDTAVLLSEIYSQWRIKQKKDKYTNCINLYVGSTQFNTGLSPLRQRKALKVLIDYGIIYVSVWGYPKTRTVTFNAYALDKLKEDLEKDKEKVTKFIELQKVIGAKNREMIEREKSGCYDDFKEFEASYCDYFQSTEGFCKPLMDFDEFRRTNSEF